MKHRTTRRTAAVSAAGKGCGGAAGSGRQMQKPSRLCFSATHLAHLNRFLMT